jgi:hypothetical protein
MSFNVGKCKVLGQITGAFHNRDKDIFVTLYKTFLQVVLEGPEEPFYT